VALGFFNALPLNAPSGVGLVAVVRRLTLARLARSPPHRVSHLGTSLGLHALFKRRRFVPVISSQAIERMASQRVIILVLVLKSGPPVEHGGGDDAPSQA
jgi:hypothetical protein